MTVAIIAIAAVYFLPTWITLLRDPPSPGAVIVVNVFLGFTIIGWIVALAMACRTPEARRA